MSSTAKVRRPQFPRDPAHPDFPHETTTGYQYGCRCDRCRLAVTKYRHRQRQHPEDRRPFGAHSCADWLDAQPAEVDQSFEFGLGFTYAVRLLRGE